MARDEHRLIGRQRELARLEQMLVTPSHQAFAVLRGEAGTGKRALLRAAVSLAGDAGLRVIASSGVEAESELPFAGLHQLLLPLLPYGARVPGTSRAVLEQVTGLRAGAPAGVAEVAGAILVLIAAAAEEGPLFFAVDDAHWFDRESARVCAFVMRRAGAVGARGIVTVRSDVTSVFDEAGLEEIEVGPLGGQEAAALLERTGSHLDPLACARVLRWTEGNPLALIELPKTVERVSAPAEQTSPLPLTRRLVRLYAHRISELAPSAQEALLLAALDGLGSVAGPRRPALDGGWAMWTRRSAAACWWSTRQPVSSASAIPSFVPRWSSSPRPIAAGRRTPNSPSSIRTIRSGGRTTSPRRPWTRTRKSPRCWSTLPGQRPGEEPLPSR